MIKVGLFVNPVAGCGQFLNLKGSDGLTLSMCPRSISLEKAVEFLTEVREVEATYITASGNMGEDAFVRAGVINFQLVHKFSGESSSADTRDFVRKLKKIGVDILVFFGGDGTARDIVDAGFSGPVLGVPLGTKMFSSVFAISVSRAVEIFTNIARGEQIGYARGEVIDLNETSYSRGEMGVSKYGFLTIPISEYIMSESKAEYPASSAEAIAQYIIDNMKDDVNYLIGPGSTCKTILSILGQKGSLLGFDLLRNKVVVKEDMTENEMYELTGSETVVVLSPIGGQGFLIGRGNKQLSGRIISRIGFPNLIVVSSEEKLRSLRGLYIDINMLTIEKPRFMRVLFSYGRFKLMPVLY